MTPILSRAHFQLTGCCNLNCVFCGQRKGMIACDERDGLAVDDWLRIARSIRDEAAAAGQIAEITLWGGEPLLWPEFSTLAYALRAPGVRLCVVTNGTLIDRHAGALNECFDEIYLSLDGEREVHDSIRGAGTFDRVAANVRLLAPRRGKLFFMTTLADETIAAAPELPLKLAEKFRPDGWIFSQLIYLSGEEIARYRSCAARLGQVEYPELAAYLRCDDRTYLEKLRLAERKIAETVYPFPVRFVGQNYPDGRFDNIHCEALYHRLHIRHDGECGCCTDYFGITLGNVRQHSADAIFHGQRAETLRRFLAAERLPICDHCPWLGQAGHFAPASSPMADSEKAQRQ